MKATFWGKVGFFVHEGVEVAYFCGCVHYKEIYDEKDNYKCRANRQRGHQLNLSSISQPMILRIEVAQQKSLAVVFA